MYTDEAFAVEEAINGTCKGEGQYEHGREECGCCTGAQRDVEDYRGVQEGRREAKVVSSIQLNTDINVIADCGQIECKSLTEQQAFEPEAIEEPSEN